MSAMTRMDDVGRRGAIQRPRWTSSIPTAARAALAGVLVAITACSEPVGVVTPEDPTAEPLPPGSILRRDGILYRAVLTSAREEGLGALVEVVNENDEPRTFRFPDTCVAMLRAYFHPNGPRAWDHRQEKTTCANEVREITVMPGDTLVAKPRALSVAILGDGLPNGIYHFRAYLIPIEEPPIELPLGEVRLALP
ncbi:MAG: hypothetical protein ACREK3_07495 [Gemmatimonadota bacterium]